MRLALVPYVLIFVFVFGFVTDIFFVHSDARLETLRRFSGHIYWVTRRQPVPRAQCTNKRMKP